MARREVVEDFFFGARLGALTGGTGCLIAGLLLIPFAAWAYALVLNPLALLFGLAAGELSVWISSGSNPSARQSSDAITFLVVHYVGAFAIVLSARWLRALPWLSKSALRYHGIQTGAAFVAALAFMLTVNIDPSGGSTDTVGHRVKMGVSLGVAFAAAQAVGRCLWVVGMALNRRMTAGDEARPY